MTRHGLNCTNSAVYSYAERKKDQKAAGYGAERMRLGKDAVKGFDCCSLTLQPTTRPVITPQGWIFDKVNITDQHYLSLFPLVSKITHGGGKSFLKKFTLKINSILGSHFQIYSG